MVVELSDTPELVLLSSNDEPREKEPNEELEEDREKDPKEDLEEDPEMGSLRQSAASRTPRQ